MDQQFTLVSDVGGTMARVGLWNNASNELVHVRQTNLPVARDPESLARHLGGMIAHVLDVTNVTYRDVRGLGLAFAGPIEGETIVMRAPNIGWESPVDLAQIASRHLDMPVRLINDGNAAALGERYHGAGRQANNLVYLTWSSGIGAGVILGGQLLVGRGRAGEVGHWLYTTEQSGNPCGCGKRGCYEAHASGTAIKQELWAMHNRGGCDDLYEIAQGMGRGNEPLDARVLAEGILRGDSYAVFLGNQVAEIFGALLANVTYAYDPYLIIIGGGVSNAWDQLVVPAADSMRRRLMHESYAPQIVRAELGDSAGLFGAATLFTS